MPKKPRDPPSPTAAKPPARARGGQKRTPKRAGKPAPQPRAHAKTTKDAKPRAPVWERAFLGALSNTGNVRAACTAAKIGRSTVYDRRVAVDAFAKAWDDAIDEAADVLEAEALRRAVHGIDEPVFYKGEEIATVRKYSDVLLIFLLKAARPQKFRDYYRAEITGKDGGPLEFDDAREALVAALGPAPDAVAGRAAKGGRSSQPSTG